MNKSFAILLSVFILMPGFAFALDYSDCDSGTVECECTPDNPFGFDQTSASSVAECQNGCNVLNDYLSSHSYSYEGEISGFSVQCQIDGITTAISQGGLDDDLDQDTGSDASSSTTEADETYPVPQLGIDIPGLEFTPAYKEGGEVTSNYLGEYIQAALNFVFPAASLLAIVIMMIGGIEYILARGDPGKITTATTHLKQAVTGIILLFGAFTIAQVVDPNFLTYDSINVTYIDKSEWYEPEIYSEIIVPGEEISGEVEMIRGEYVLNWAEDGYLNPAAVDALETASNAFFQNEGVRIKVTSARRTVTKQAEMFYDNCLSNSTRSCSVLTCNPASGTGIITGSSSGYTLAGELSGVTDRTTIINTIVSHANLANCPHTSSIAVDVWCDDGGKEWAHEPNCQKALSEAMVANGFCRISAEAWHFELNSMHVCGDCSTANTYSYTVHGTTYSPDLSCAKWDYKNNKCQ